MFQRVHHVAYIVGELDEAIDQFNRLSGLEPDFTREMSDDFHLEVAVYDIGGVLVELISPTREEGWVYDYWTEHGDGFFHIAFEVPDIDEAITRFREQNVGIDGPREGLEWMVATLDSEATIGTMQVVED